MRTTLITLAVALLFAGTFAPAARADGGPSPGVTFDARGISNRASPLTYMSEAAGNLSNLNVRDRSENIVKTRTFEGLYGIPLVTYGGARGGLSRDGRTLVVARAPEGGAALAAVSRFLVLNTRTLRTRRMIELLGDFSFDALSPDARMLYLIQHSSATDYERYRVRAYDLARGRLLPSAIVDRTEPNMRGTPMARLVGPGGRWVYTFYVHQRGEPFVHALDTVHAQARCLDVEWHGNQRVLWSAHLELTGGRLAVVSSHGKRIAELELQSARASGFGVGWLGAIGALVLASAAVAVWSHRRRTRQA
jgi:hypothetical protein